MAGCTARELWNMTREEVSQATAITRVLQILSDGRARTPREIHQPHGLLSRTVTGALLTLVRDGRVIREGEVGFYRYRKAAT